MLFYLLLYKKQSNELKWLEKEIKIIAPENSEATHDKIPKEVFTKAKVKLLHSITNEGHLN